jgi:hypothetical protein
MNALHIIELVKSLPAAEQQTVRDALTKLAPRPRRVGRPLFQRDANGTYYNPDGIPNDDPVFTILEAIESERHRTTARPLPEVE